MVSLHQWGLAAGYQPRPHVVDRGTTTRYGGQLRYKRASSLSVYRSRFEALPSIGSAILAKHTVKRSNNAIDNGHTRAALQTTVMGSAATCDEQAHRHRATMA